ncbi:MAG: ATP-binding protein [Candidatus Aenigmatarchaeota archaeon]
MKIHKVILENFRAFYGSVEIEFKDFNVLIGKNDQGKSSILEGIDIFINEGRGTTKIDENDLNQKAKNEGKDIFRIGIVFRDIPEKVVIDSTNQTNLKDEYLLNQDNYLEIWKSFKKGKVQETFIKCYHPVNDDFLKNIMQKKITDLQKFVKDNSIDTSNIDNRKSADLRKKIREYYKNKDGSLSFETIEIKIDSEGLKEIWPALQKYLPLYGLFHSDRKNVDQDDEIQDPLKFRIEQIFKREDIQSKLYEIAKEIDKEIQEFAQKTVEEFNKLNNNSLQINITPNIPQVETLKWKDVYKGVGYNTDENIPLNKRGSGVRRMVLLSSFLAEVKKNKQSENHIIYAIEEPETSLHPDLQIKLVEALQTLARSGFHQIFITTHSPALLRLFETDDILYTEQENGDVRVQKWSENILDKVIKNLGLIPNIGKVIICVEGKNDEQFLLNINENIPELKNIVNLKEKIDSGILAIIPMGGSNLKDWINRYAMKNTNAVEFHLYDRDADMKYRESVEKVNKRKDGSKGVLTKKREIENYIPKSLIEQELNITLDNIEDWDNDDITEKILQKLSGRKKENIKSQLCCSISKKITKQDLESLNAFEEVCEWFTIIRDLINKVIKNHGDNL